MSADHEPQKRKSAEAESAQQGEMEDQPSQSTRSHAEILYLQRTLGNRAVAQMLKPSSAPQGVVQRMVGLWKLLGLSSTPKEPEKPNAGATSDDAKASSVPVDALAKAKADANRAAVAARSHAANALATREEARREARGINGTVAIQEAARDVFASIRADASAAGIAASAAETAASAADAAATLQAANASLQAANTALGKARDAAKNARKGLKQIEERNFGNLIRQNQNATNIVNAVANPAAAAPVPAATPAPTAAPAQPIAPQQQQPATPPALAPTPAPEPTPTPAPAAGAGGGAPQPVPAAPNFFANEKAKWEIWCKAVVDRFTAKQVQKGDHNCHGAALGELPTNLAAGTHWRQGYPYKRSPTIRVFVEVDASDKPVKNARVYIAKQMSHADAPLSELWAYRRTSPGEFIHYTGKKYPADKS